MRATSIGHAGLLIDTLDGIALALYARAEYCTDWDRSLAEDGEWVFPITE